MDLRQQMSGIRGWLPLILVCALVSGALAFLVSGLVSKTYEGKSLLVVGQSLSAVNPDVSELLASQRLTSTYAELATTRPILRSVIDELGLDDTTETLAARVDASAPVDSTFLSITATDPDPETAAAIANSLAAALIEASPERQGQEAEILAFVSEELRATQEQIVATQAEIARLLAIEDRSTTDNAQLTRLETTLTSLRSSYASLLAFASNDAANLLSVVEEAVAGPPVSPRPLLNAALATLLAILLVTGAVVLWTYFDQRLRDAAAVQSTASLSTLGSIPRMRSHKGRKELYQLAMLLYPTSSAAESYRTVRTNLEFAAVDGAIRTLLVTSPGPGEGKTVTAANLAVAFAQAGQRVILVDADLRKPGLHTMFDVPNGRGLSDLLRGGSGPDAILQATDEPKLRLLTTGLQPPNPAELLGSQRMRSVIGGLADSTDLIIVDSPPLLLVADAAILSSFVDGVLVVVDAGKTRRDDLRRAAEALAKAGARVVGVVLNGLPAGDFASYGEHYGAAASSAVAADPDPSR